MQEVSMSQSTENNPAPTKTKGGWNWGWSIALVYTIFALGTLSWAYYSFSQKVDLVSDDYYDKELKFDQHAVRVRNSLNLATPVRETYNADASQITLSFPQAVSGGTVVLYRPSESSMDKTLALRTEAENSMTIPTNSLTKGWWRIKVEWDSNGKSYYDEFSQML